jgi:hypothetical protein
LIREYKDAISTTPRGALAVAMVCGVTEALRLKVLESGWGVIMCGEYIDKGPRDDTRKLACEDPDIAWRYALSIDKGPRDDTRAATCRGVPNSAQTYAKAVDKRPRRDTFLAAARHPKGRYSYLTYFALKEEPTEN